MDTLLPPIREIIQEYQGGIRVKNGVVQINGKEMETKVNTGIWFIHHMPYIYNNGITEINTIMMHHDAKVEEIRAERKGDLIPANSLSLLVGGIEFNTLYYSDEAKVFPPIIHNNHIVIMRVRESRIEKRAAILARDYCLHLAAEESNNALCAVIPRMETLIECSKARMCLPLCEVKSVRAKVFPRLREYKDVQQLTIVRSDDKLCIKLFTADASFELRPDDLYGGTGAKGIGIFLDGYLHRYLEVYQILMKKMDESKKLIYDVEDREGEMWIEQFIDERDAWFRLQ